MKRLLMYGCILAFSAGCMKFGPSEGIQSQAGIRERFDRLAERQAPAVDVSARKDLTGLPPQADEVVAQDFKIERGDRMVEVEGVCSLNEDGVTCWNANGERNEALTKEFTDVFAARNDNYSNNFQFRFMKKNRVLVLKTTVKPFKPGTTGGSFGYGLMYENNGDGSKEGWSNSYGSWPNSGGARSDETRIERQMLVGAFKKETETFPLRYQFTTSTMDRVPIPFVKGQFTVDGNSYEILDISDKPLNGQGAQYYGGRMPLAKPLPMTYVKIQVVNITKPNSILNLQPAGKDGKPYAGLNDKGEPINQNELMKLQLENQRKMMEAQRTGKPFAGGYNPMGNYIQPLNIDPSAPYAKGTYYGTFNIAMSKINKLSISVHQRTVFVFDQIRLDPK